MGTTHYWRRPTELAVGLFAAAVQDERRAVEAVSIPLAGFEGTGQPLFEDNGIVFNGVRPHACEPFELKVVEFDRRGRQQVSSYCKTENAPYDFCVRLALIVFEHHLRASGFEVSSDDPANDWAAPAWSVSRRSAMARTLSLRRDVS